jgi:polyhydroxyalkanoate synthesis regulator phasin
MVLNLFIGIIVNAMQEEYAKAEAAERAAEREMIQEEAAPLVREIKELKAEIAALRREVAAGLQAKS